MKNLTKSINMTIEEKDKVFANYISAFNETTDEINKHLSDSKSSGRIPCVYVLGRKSEQLKFWSDRMIKLSTLLPSDYTI